MIQMMLGRHDANYQKLELLLQSYRISCKKGIALCFLGPRKDELPRQDSNLPHYHQSRAQMGLSQLN